jgi:hypothetical protein
VNEENTEIIESRHLDSHKSRWDISTRVKKMRRSAETPPRKAGVKVQLIVQILLDGEAGEWQGNGEWASRRNGARWLVVPPTLRLRRGRVL